MVGSMYCALVLASLIASLSGEQCLGSLYPYDNHQCVYIEILPDSFSTYQMAVDMCSVRKVGSVGWFGGSVLEIKQPEFEKMVAEWKRGTGRKPGTTFTFWTGLIRDEAKDPTESADSEKWLEASKWRWKSGVTLAESMAKGVHAKWANDKGRSGQRCAFASVDTDNPVSLLLYDHECNDSASPHIDHVLCQLDMKTKVQPPSDPGLNEPLADNAPHTAPSTKKFLEWKSVLIGAAIGILVTAICGAIGFVIVRRWNRPNSPPRPKPTTHVTEYTQASGTDSSSDGEKKASEEPSVFPEEEHSYVNISGTGKKKDKKVSRSKRVKQSLMVGKKKGSMVILATKKAG